MSEWKTWERKGWTEFKSASVPATSNVNKGLLYLTLGNRYQKPQENSFSDKIILYQGSEDSTHGPSLAQSFLYGEKTKKVFYIFKRKTFVTETIRGL